MEVLDIVLSLLQFLGVLVAAIGLIYAAKQYKAETERRKMEKSLELSRYFAEKIIISSSLISPVYKALGIGTKISNLLKNNAKIEFDTEFFSAITDEEQVNNIKELCAQADNPEVIYAVMREVGIKQLHLGDIDPIGSGDDKEKLRNMFRGAKVDLMNIIEWFSMQFTVGVADEACVYQSLHVTFCSFVQMLFYDYCESNKNRSGASKLYTSTERLYNMWSARHLETEILERETISNARTSSQYHKSLSQ